MGNRMEGKAVIVTGAGSGIGEAAALLFAKEGAQVAVLDRSEQDAQRVADTIASAGGRSIAVAADVSKEQQVKDAVERTVRALGTVDALVNNAAVQVMGPLHTFTEEQFDQLVNVNLKGVFFGCKHVLPLMMEKGKGAIVSTSSILGLYGDADLGIYGATKGALIALTKSMAVAYGPHGIRVNCICPGDVATPMVKAFFDFQPDPAAAREQVYGHYPLRRIAEPQEVAEAMVFLASDQASFLSGTSLLVDGGLSAEVY